LDGGYLLRKVVWQRKSSATAIVSGYINYVKTHFGSNVSEEAVNKNTKSAKRLRRCAAHFCRAEVKLAVAITQVPLSVIDPLNTHQGQCFLCMHSAGVTPLQLLLAMVKPSWLIFYTKAPTCETCGTFPPARLK
jgi:hypothetical protein